jgi:hypothetical protein
MRAQRDQSNDSATGFFQVDLTDVFGIAGAVDRKGNIMSCATLNIDH